MFAENLSDEDKLLIKEELDILDSVKSELVDQVSAIAEGKLGEASSVKIGIAETKDEWGALYEQLNTFNALAKQKGKKVQVGIRLNPNTDAKTLSQISTGKKENKFGVDNKTFLKLINFCGSVDEPTTHPDFINIVDYFLNFTKINVATNGSTRTEKFWSELGKKNISAFFGVDGIDQKSLEKYRIGSNFKKVKENWRAFIKAGGVATWQFIVFDHNEHLLQKI